MVGLFVKSAIDSNGLRRMADLACARVNAEIAPQKIADINVIRRRIEDALRKTATAMDLIAIASLLGVKIE